MRIPLVSAWILIAACSKSPSTSSPPSDAQTPDEAAETEARPELTASACEAAGGHVVGDIGDGAIHRTEYRCPESGEPPIGSIAADAGGPIAVEGAVCCK